MFSWPFSRELSFSYRTGDSNFSVTVVDFVPTFTISSVFSLIILLYLLSESLYPSIPVAPLTIVSLYPLSFVGSSW